jgi:hypothetical protein
VPGYRRLQWTVPIIGSLICDIDRGIRLGSEMAAVAFGRAQLNAPRSRVSDKGAPEVSA